MTPHRSRLLRIASIGAAVLTAGSVIAYAAIVLFRYDAIGEHIGLWAAPPR